MSRFINITLIFLTLSSCIKEAEFDPASGKTRGDIKDALMRSKDERKNKIDKKDDDKKEANTNYVPKLSKMIAAPPPPKIGGDKLISFSVTDQVPLKDVLIEIGRVAKIDLDIDPTISGGVIINAIDRPLKEVIDRIASLGNLRYTYNNGVLKFERDTPFLKNYYVDYLIDGSLWSDVESNITAILSSANNNSSNISTTNNSPFGGQQSSGGGSIASYTSNKSAGIISVFATLQQHDLVEKYLSAVEKTASAQVLIEAKVVEVTLRDQFKTGIDWSWSSGARFNVETADPTGDAGATTTVVVPRRQMDLSGGYDTTSPMSLVLTNLMGGDLNASVSALDSFGTTKTLSSPRIHAMNNQAASLNFADKLVYFEIDNSQTTSTTDSNNVVETLSSEVKEEDVGVQLEITPSINLRTKEVVMKIKPTLSVKSDDVDDPASPTNSAGEVIFVNKVPVIQTREIETMAKVQSGNVIVIGGLMKEETTDSENGIPFLSDIPILGLLFKSNSKDTKITETVIFIKATIVDSSTPVNKIDREMQEIFDSNRRKFFE